MNKFYILIAILAAFGLGWLTSNQMNPGPEKDPKEAKAKANNKGAKQNGEEEKKVKAIPVAVEAISIGDISSFIAFNTSVTSEQSLDIHSEIDGVIASLEVEEGDRVKAGDPLLILVNDDHRIQKEESKSNLDNLENEFVRAQRMAKDELITTQEFETRRYELDQARFRYERDRLRYERSILRAPFDGVVTERFTQVGARISPTTPLFHIVNTNQLIARVFIPEKHLHSISAGQPVEIESSSLPDQTWKGTIKRISPSIDIETGTFKATIAIESKDDSLPAGLFVSARILTEIHKDTALVPKQAIIYENEEQYIYIVEDNKAMKRIIEPGIANSDHVEALSDVEAGELVIVQGQIGLKDKTEVEIVGPHGNDAEEQDTKTASSEEEVDDSAS